ncbi:MAG: M20/M25/M40 family metallo-hydrolase [Trueperaceae bacterium]
MPTTLTAATPILEFLKLICETPAPTFAEAARGELIERLLRTLGLNPRMDCVGNIIADIPGGTGQRVLVAAHLDTVFPIDTNVSIREGNQKLFAPGIGDNSASLAVMLSYLEQTLSTNDTRPRLTFAATVGEEGLGDLRGMRELMGTRTQDFDAVIALDGHLGTIVDKAVGSRRFEVTFSAKGGHSWGDFPSPSAIHALGDAVHALNHMVVPREPRSSYNVGEICGGTSINAIAQKAMFNLDLRSLDAKVLESLEQDALRRIRRAVREHSTDAHIKQVGDRPVGKCDNAWLVALAKEALQSVGVLSKTAASSTDANAAMALGVPAIAFGVYNGGDAHRLSEWLEPSSLQTGYRAFVELMKRLA